MIDASIYQRFAQPAKSVSDFDAEADARDASRLNLLLQRGQVSDRETARAEQQRLLNTLRGMDPNAPDEARIGTLRRAGFVTQADAYQDSLIKRDKGRFDNAETVAKTAKLEAETRAATAEQKWKAADRHVQSLAGATTIEDGVNYINTGVRAGILPMEGQAGALKLLQEQGIEAFKRIAYQKSIPNIDRYKEEAATARAAATNQVSRDNNAATVAATYAGQRSTAATAEAGRQQADRLAGQAMTKPFEVTGPDGAPILVQQDKLGNIKQVEGFTPKAGAAKPLAPSALKLITEARDNARTITDLSKAFKPEFGDKGVLGLGADASMAVKGTFGRDKDSVEWWKNYRKQAELIERHALFGAALTPTEQASWRSADIGPGMDADVIAANLAARATLAARVLESARQDLIDAGYAEKQITSIAGRNAEAQNPFARPGLPMAPKPGAAPASSAVDDALKKYGPK